MKVWAEFRQQSHSHGFTLTAEVKILIPFVTESVRGKRVLVTGASTGIGEQLAYHYARLGARLVITARREHVLKEVVKRCREVGSKDGDYHFMAADMSDMTQTKAVIKVHTHVRVSLFKEGPTGL